jgi:RHS repeat-associated protein
LQYDLAGNVINDGVNKYVYDLDGRICAVENILAGTATQYVYDAEGRRVGKGTINTWPAAGATCAAPTTANGFTLTNQYLRGVSGDQDTELDGSLALQHTNIYAGAGVMASYWNSGTDAAPAFKLSYIYNDWLGTKRRQESSAGLTESSWKSDPFGDYMTPAIGAVNSEANEMHLTGKERDKESGNDYFGARYYASPMGRFMSPDWSAKEEPVPYAKLGNPQTLNLYAFVGNNPISHVDVDGHDYGQMEAQYAENNADNPNFVGESMNQHQYIQSAMQSVSDGLGDGGLLSLDFGYGTGGGQNNIAGGGQSSTPEKQQSCSKLSLDDPATFGNATAATPEQVEAFFSSYSTAPSTWDGAAAATAFSAADLNPGLAVGIVGAETSFKPSNNRNATDPFSSGGSNFTKSLARGLGAITKIEAASFNSDHPLANLTNARNHLRGEKLPGMQYDITKTAQWTKNVNSFYRKFEQFNGVCK